MSLVYYIIAQNELCCLAKMCAISGITACTNAKVWCFAPLHLATLRINRTSSGIFGNVWKLSDHL